MSALNPFEAQAKLAKLPVSPEAINYLMALANGANSEIPRFMALGRLEQMKQELASNKPSQPPQGTVKDKIEQAVGIMALRGGQQQQAAQQMAQGAPQRIPQGIPQPQMQPQPEEEQMPEMDVQTGAGGGLMHARVDPRMFNFAPGGIVSFARGGEMAAETSKEELAADELRVRGIQEEKERQEKKERMAFLEKSAPEVAARIKAEELAASTAAVTTAPSGSAGASPAGVTSTAPSGSAARASGVARPS